MRDASPKAVRTRCVLFKSYGKNITFRCLILCSSTSCVTHFSQGHRPTYASFPSNPLEPETPKIFSSVLTNMQCCKHVTDLPFLFLFSQESPKDESRPNKTFMTSDAPLGETCKPHPENLCQLTPNPFESEWLFCFKNSLFRFSFWQFTGMLQYFPWAEVWLTWIF